jgi:hypothetical protein
MQDCIIALYNHEGGIPEDWLKIGTKGVWLFTVYSWGGDFHWHPPVSFDSLRE